MSTLRVEGIKNAAAASHMSKNPDDYLDIEHAYEALMEDLADMSPQEVYAYWEAEIQYLSRLLKKEQDRYYKWSGQELNLGYSDKAEKDKIVNILSNKN